MEISFLYIILLAGIPLIWTILYYIPLNFWFQCRLNQVRISLLQLIMMRWHKVPPSIIVMAMVNSKKAGLDLNADQLEAHYLAGGNVQKVVNALILADKANIPLDFKAATVIDLSGRDVLEAVQMLVNPNNTNTTTVKNMYHYVDSNGQQQGPVAAGDLPRYGVTPQTLVWRQEMSGWQPAGTVGELSGLFAPCTVPTYAPQQPMYAPQQPMYAPQQPSYVPQQPSYAPQQPSAIGFEWYVKCLRQCYDFKGRARRKEYWMFNLFYMIFGIVAMILDNLLGTTIEVLGQNTFYGWLYLIYCLLFFLPGLAVLVRRLHDIGESGFEIFFFLIGVVFCGFLAGLSGGLIQGDNISDNMGSIILMILFSLIVLVCIIRFIVWLFTDSQPGANKWGVNPKGF